MCGRYATTRGAVDLSSLFDAYDDTAEAGGLVPDYNVAPTDPVPIVRISDRLGGRTLSVARWGLVPAWAREPKQGARMINARAETVATSNAFRPSFARRRCLVPADGWYEWTRMGTKSRQAHYMTPRDGSMLAFAGLWATWGTGADRLMTCSIVTTAARGDLAAVHDRMPLMLPSTRWNAWLSSPADTGFLLETPSHAFLDAIEIRPVGPAVGDVRNDGPALIERIATEPRPPVEEAVDLTLF
jgi:putative SOS response-associated peptidase YedK